MVWPILVAKSFADNYPVIGNTPIMGIEVIKIGIDNPHMNPQSQYPIITVS